MADQAFEKYSGYRLFINSDIWNLEKALQFHHKTFPMCRQMGETGRTTSPHAPGEGRISLRSTRRSGRCRRHTCCRPTAVSPGWRVGRGSDGCGLCGAEPAAETAPPEKPTPGMSRRSRQTPSFWSGRPKTIHKYTFWNALQPMDAERAAAACLVLA